MIDQKLLVEVFFYKHKEDDNICFHIGEIHIATLTQEEAQMLIQAMDRENVWNKIRLGGEGEIQA